MFGMMLANTWERWHNCNVHASTGLEPGFPPGPPAPLPGFAPPSRVPGLSRGRQQSALMAFEALKRRIGLGIGPTPARWSTYPGEGLTPELIVRYRKEAHAGLPWRWADLCEQVIERNSHIQSCMHFRRAWAVNDTSPWRIDPPREFEDDPTAKLVSAWQTAILNQTSMRDIWPDAIYQLLSASAYGYAGAEQFWEERVIRFRCEGKDYAVPSFVPVSMEAIHQKCFRFTLDGDRPGLYSNEGEGVLHWPDGKILFHRCLGDGITERRGWMTAGIWIEYALQQGWADLLIYMHLYGIPQIGVFVEKEILDQDEERSILDEAITNWGQGKIPIWLNEMEVKPLGEVKGADEIHPKVIQMAKHDLSVLITGSLLAQTQGEGTGSYGASKEHATTAHIYRVPDGTQLATSISRGTLRPSLRFNKDNLCRAFKCSPEHLENCSGVFGWKTSSPAPTTTEIIGEYVQLAGIGFPASIQEISQRTGRKIADGADRIPGATQSVKAGDAVLGNVLAGPGAMGPPKEEPAPKGAEATNDAGH